MNLSGEKLRWLVAQASTLTERVDGNFVPCGGDEAMSRRRLARLREVTAKSDPQGFALFPSAVGSGGEAEKSLLALLGPVQQPDDAALPSWASLLNNLIHHTARVFALRSLLPPIGRSKIRLPYVHLYWPIIEYARAQIEHTHPGASLLGPGAWQGLKSYLCSRIASIASPALQPAFLAHRALSDSGILGHFLNTAHEGTGRSLYLEYVLEQGCDGLASFFLRYPVVGRLVSEVTQFWIEFVGELLSRLESDATALSVRFNGGLPLGKVSAVAIGISDPHHGGRSVMVLTFACGQQVVYKPRALQVDQVFYGLVHALNERTRRAALRTVEVLNRGTYGWMEFVHHAPCATRQAARRYYRRAGALVCLVHWLQGIDFHRENVVAAGEHPVLVDLEALAHPVLSGENPFVTEGAGWSLAGSALRTGLLPLWHPHPAVVNARYDNCGLDAKISQPAFYPSSLWRHVNTDRMQLSFAHRSRRHVTHRPTLSGRVLAIKAFQKEVLAGYSQVARVLDGPNRSRFAESRALIVGSPRRCIKRPTRLYNFLLRHSIQPRFLQAGVDRSIELWALPQRGASDTRELAEEISCLERLDVPYFQVEASTESFATQATGLHSQLGQIRLASQRKLVLENGWVRPVKS